MKDTGRWIVIAVATALPLLASATQSVHGETVGTVVMRERRIPGARRVVARTTWDSVYSAEQAGRGETTYLHTCSRCHQPSLGGADEAPALTGSAFLSAWNGQTLGDLHERVRTTMPTDTPGTYSRQDISDVIAYVLKFNQFPAGKIPLPTGDEELKGITFVTVKP